MKILYLDCAMGAAGDMLSAALMQLCPDPERILQGINALHLPGIEVCLEESRKCGIAGAHYAVKIHGEEENQVRAPHRHGLHLHEIQEIIDRSGLPEEVCENSRAVYRLLAEAESRVHGKKAEHIHFHEVGTLDAIVDILTVCLLIHELNPERICASAIHLGSGTVKCAHGELPVPAPATAELLRGIPAYTADIQGELCTPTGAALLKHFVDQFGPMPEIAAEKIGYGMVCAFVFPDFFDDYIFQSKQFCSIRKTYLQMQHFSTNLMKPCGKYTIGIAMPSMTRQCEKFEGCLNLIPLL